MTDDETSAIDPWAKGWAFYVGGGKSDALLPLFEDCGEWIKGYCAAMADYDLEPYREHPSIQAALLRHGIDGELLEVCLKAADAVVAGDEWNRWPSVPTRGFGDNHPNDAPFVRVLPEAANDEVG